MDPEGYLWVSDMENDKIYKIDLTEGLEGTETTGAADLSLSSNPFNASVTITGDGFSSTARLEIYDIRGMLVLEDTFHGAFTWNGSSPDGTQVPSGAYFAIVTDTDGNLATTELLRL